MPAWPGGCTFWEAPNRTSGTAAVFWRADVNPAVLPVEACPVSRNGIDAFDVRRIETPVILLRPGNGIEHVLIGDGVRRIQLEVRGQSLLAGPVRLRYDLAGFAGIEPKLMTLQRLTALRRLGRFP